MGGASLWLVPPPSHPLHDILTTLINDNVPALFPGRNPPRFPPHMTLTSDISLATYGDQPQEWLDSVPWPAASDVKVVFEKVKTEDFFFRRCYLKVSYEWVGSVAGIARARGVYDEASIGPKTEKWLAEWKGSFGPHVSLMYEDISLDEEKIKEVTEVVTKAGVTFAGESGNSGWEGGVVWLVATDGPIDTWKPIATKVLQ